MGNFLAEKSDVTSKGEIANRSDNHPLTKSEKDALSTLYQKLMTVLLSGDDSTFYLLLKSSRFAEFLKSSDHLESYDKFESFFVHAARVNDTVTVQTLWEILPEDEFRIKTFFALVLDIGAVADDCIEVEVDRLCKNLNAFMRSWHGDSEPKVINFACLMRWIQSNGACTSSLISTFMNSLCFDMGSMLSFSPFSIPHLDTRSEIAKPSELAPLALCSNGPQGLWKRLYTSSCDGLSFNRIVHHVLGYNGPTCILIKSQDKQHVTFGAFCHERWRESNRFFGSSKNFIFSLHPELKILKSKDSSNGSYQWLNSKSFSAPHGIGIGGSTEAFRIFIPDSLEGCVAKASCLTFERGNLLPPVEDQPTGSFSSIRGEDGLWTQDCFDIDCLEIWACGGADAIQKGLEAQRQDRAIRDEVIQKARKVDKAQFFNNAFDAEFLLGETLSHRQQISDRDN